MKFKFKQDKWDDSRPKKKFCVLPARAVDGEAGCGHYLVWLEWVTWSDSYKAWVIDKQVQGLKSEQGTN